MDQTQTTELELKKIKEEIERLKNNHKKDIERLELMFKGQSISKEITPNAHLENQHSSDEKQNFNFDLYKIQVVNNDCSKIEKFLADKKLKKVWHFIPIIGYFIYQYDLSIVYAGIDRGLLRQNYQKFYIRWIVFEILQWCVALPMIINLEPFIATHCFKKALNKTREDLKNIDKI
ncbi:hypothetical protein [Spiroplasma endosymbiont of Amphibalanus improvisus]|uniref:hypothetical protein n=1 Tax=Spiroplasma endosymbiont of Amphibalanus improvisus TaxID=3066327 RepID=UPI00313B04F7